MASRRKELTFLWFIENYSYCAIAQRSPLFGMAGAYWMLESFPRAEHKGFISLFLKRFGSKNGPEFYPIKFELSVLAEDGSVLSSKEYDHSFEKWARMGYHYFLKADKILFRRNFPQDILTLRCKMWKGEGDVDRVAPIHARTRIGVEKVSFLHDVETFSLLQPNQKDTLRIRSPANTKKGPIASSSLYFTFDSVRDGEIISEVTPYNSSYFLCKRKISLLDAFGNEILCADYDNRWFDIDRKDNRLLPLPLKRRDILEKKSEYLPNDKLSLKCECRFSTGAELKNILKTPYEMPMAVAKRTDVQAFACPSAQDDIKCHQTNDKLSLKSESSFYTGLELKNILKTPHEMPKAVAKRTDVQASASPSAQEDIKFLYMKKSLIDVELKTKTKSFPAHKNVLCARSPVFDQMTSDMGEKNIDHIQVDDLEDDVVEQLLLFLYSDTVENLQWDMATQLYYAAKKYQVGGLKAVCSSFLKENLTPTNAGELLILAVTHSDTELEKMVEDFILEHDREVFGSREWEKLMKSHPSPALKTMHQKYKRQKKAH